MKARTAILAIAAVAGLAACEREEIATAPTERGACFYIAQLPDGEIRYNRIAENQPNIEECAAQLEVMRISFLQKGGSNFEILGAYQGRFLFLLREGIFTSERLSGAKFPLLVRYEGYLVPPGATPVPK